MERAASKRETSAWPRHGGWFAGGGLIVVAMIFAAAARAWYLPNEPQALWREAAGAALALGVALVAFAALRSVMPRRITWTFLPVLWAAAYGLAGTVGLRVTPAGFAFGGPRTYLYAPEGCGFTVRLPARPSERLERLETAPGQAADVTVAILSDLPTASAYRVECVGLASGADAHALLAIARDRARAWAGSGQLEIERIEEIAGPSPGLRLIARGQGLDATGQPWMTRLAMRTAIGPDSMATVIVSRLGGLPPDETAIASLAFRGN